MFMRDFFDDLTEKVKGLIKLPDGMVIWLNMVQRRIWDRWEQREGLKRFCDWADRLTREKLNITSKVFLSIPNLLCVARLAIVPVYLLWLALGANKWFYLATYLFLMALDVLDGPIARQTGTDSDFGKAIDPLSDKTCHLGMALVAVSFGFAPLWLFVNLALKEGLLMSQSSHYLNSGSKIYGKFGTAIEVIVLSLAFIFPLSFWWFLDLVILHWAIYIAYRITDVK